MRGLPAVVAGIGLALTLAPPAALVREAAKQGQAAPKAQVERIETAPIVIDGEVLFRLRGITGYPAKERAEVVAERIREIARDKAIPVSALRIVEGEDRTSLLSGERPIARIFDIDGGETVRAAGTGCRSAPALGLCGHRALPPRAHRRLSPGAGPACGDRAGAPRCPVARVAVAVPPDRSGGGAPFPVASQGTGGEIVQAAVGGRAQARLAERPAGRALRRGYWYANEWISTDITLSLRHAIPPGKRCLGCVAHNGDQ